MRVSDWAILKANARRIYREQIKVILPAVFIVALITGLVELGLQLVNDRAIGLETEGVISGLSQAISLLVGAPLTLGLISLYLRLLGGETARAGNVFDWLREGRKLGRAIVIKVYLLFITLVQVLIHLVPAVFLGGLFGSYGLVYFLALAALVLALANVFLYEPGQYLLAGGEEGSAVVACAVARGWLRPYKWDFFRFKLSFLLYYIPSGILLYLAANRVMAGGDAFGTALYQAAGIFLTAFVAPYVELASIQYFGRVREQQERPEDRGGPFSE